jgi:hypothetical protein
VPEILLVITNLFFFIYGIIDANTAYIDLQSGLISYGIFGFKSKFATWILWFVIGFFGSLIDWAIFRIIISPIAMLVMNGDAGFFERFERHSKKCSTANDMNAAKSAVKATIKNTLYEKPTPQARNKYLANKPQESAGDSWECTCGMRNSPSSSECLNCFKPRPK